MPEDNAFKRGEAKAKLENIEQDVAEIKEEMRDHNISDKEEFSKINDKLDIANDSARAAAELARVALNKSEQLNIIQENRHAENAESLQSIKDTVESLSQDMKSLTKDQNDLKLRLYIGATLLGMGGGIGAGQVIPIIKDLLV